MPASEQPSVLLFPRGFLRLQHLRCSHFCLLCAISLSVLGVSFKGCVIQYQKDAIYQLLVLCHQHELPFSHKALACLIKNRKKKKRGKLITLHCLESKNFECLIQTTFWHGRALHGVLSGSSPSSVRPSVCGMSLKSLLVWTLEFWPPQGRQQRGRLKHGWLYLTEMGISSEHLEKLCFKNICCWLALDHDFLFANHHWAAQRTSLLHIILKSCLNCDILLREHRKQANASAHSLCFLCCLRGAF